jgi:protein-L-isoaspartate O-methyltransferase
MSQQKWEGLIEKLVRSDILRSPKVIRALRQVPREPFLPENMKHQAAMDCPLPIGSGQTASAPLSQSVAIDWAKHGIHNG